MSINYRAIEVLEETQALHDNLVSEGYEEEEIALICADFVKDYEEKAEIKRHINLRKHLPLSEINKLAWVKERGGYKNMNEADRDKLLWALGIDTKKFKYTTDIGYFVFQDRKQFGEFVVGQERSDREWTEQLINELHVCSYEAILKRRGHFRLYAEIKRELSGS